MSYEPQRWKVTRTFYVFGVSRPEQAIRFSEYMLAHHVEALAEPLPDHGPGLLDGLGEICMRDGEQWPCSSVSLPDLSSSSPLNTGRSAR